MMTEISKQADDCVKQITGWIKYLDGSEVQGKRHLTPARREEKESVAMSKKYWNEFLRNLKPNHPLYNTEEAKAARESNRQ